MCKSMEKYIFISMFSDFSNEDVNLIIEDVNLIIYFTIILSNSQKDSKSLWNSCCAVFTAN